MKMSECERGDCKFQLGPGSTIIGMDICKTYITNITLHNPPIKPPTCIIECLTCGKKWVAYTERNQTTYEEIK